MPRSISSHDDADGSAFLDRSGQDPHQFRFIGVEELAGQDNCATHKTPAVKRWLKAHPRFHLHVTPTSSSWLNMVEGLFAEITRNRIRRGVSTSVAELKVAITDYMEKHNADPKPFVWTKSAGEILEKGARAKQALEPQL